MATGGEHEMLREGETARPALAAGAVSPITVDKGVPLPPKATRGRTLNERNRPFNRRYPWQQMDVGDSFVFPAERDPNKTQQAASRIASIRAKSHPGEGYTTRLVTENGELVCRVWKVA